MIGVEQAIAELLEKISPITDIESIELTSGLGRVLAQDIIAGCHVPPADNSAMDGYALNTNDITKSTVLPISQTIAAGHPPKPLTQGTAARIFTGAEIPEGANAVVMQEHCESNGAKVTVPQNIEQNNNIRPRGQDITAGSVVLSRGRLLQPQDLGLIASVGISHIHVYRPLTVAIISSGDELVEPGYPLTSGKIYNSNRYLLHGILRKMNIQIMDIGITQDTEEATIASLREAATADCIISTGGVSVGDEDHIKRAVMQLGNIDFWRIAIKPGKPVAFGHIDETPFLGLPGNPASVFVTFLLFARPMLLTMQHQQAHTLHSLHLPADFAKKANPKRQEYLRGRINDKGHIEIHPNQSSGVLSSTSWAQGLVIIPAQREVVPGDNVEFIDFKQLGL